jgi:hypothetical protein
MLNESPETTVRGWSTGATAKERSTVQRSVTALLDTLAPERVIKRDNSAPHGPIEQHRTPGGCVLQAEDAALSVSWFPETRSDKLGELHVNVWRGTVSRGGTSYRKPVRASIVSERVLRPVPGSPGGCIWRADDGSEFDNRALAAHCTALLDAQIRSTSKAV